MTRDNKRRHENVAGILLAAGQSSRFGSDKMLYRLPQSGLFMIEQSASKLLQTMERCVTVVRPDALQVKQVLDSIGMPWVDNPQTQSGMSSSLQCGMAFHRHAGTVAAWLFALADMPYVSQQTIKRVVGAMEQGASIAVPAIRGRRGHPVAFAHCFESDLLSLRGDVGARSIIDKYREQLTYIDVDDIHIATDIDTPLGLAAWV